MVVLFWRAAECHGRSLAATVQEVGLDKKVCAEDNKVGADHTWVVFVAVSAVVWRLEARGVEVWPQLHVSGCGLPLVGE